MTIARYSASDSSSVCEFDDEKHTWIRCEAENPVVLCFWSINKGQPQDKVDAVFNKINEIASHLSPSIPNPYAPFMFWPVGWEFGPGCPIALSDYFSYGDFARELVDFLIHSAGLMPERSFGCFRREPHSERPLTYDGRRFEGIGDWHRVFATIEEAKDFADAVVWNGIRSECVIHDASGSVVEVVRRESN